ncbi:hypothetical protein MXB_1001 [Myxobolus squamalis]|nr:hypothetical protein MXB_1001 [Myxobolus squamalis]
MDKRSYIEKFVVCVTGVFFSYLIYGYFHEKIAKTKYEGETFQFFSILMFFQCLINMIWAFSESCLHGDKIGENRIPQHLYLFCGFTYLFAMLSSTTALKFVSYPAQVF